MCFESRNGKRKLRSELTNRRKPELGYYLIVTDTEGTERVYFNGLRDSIKDVVRDKLIIKVVETKNRNMIKEAKEFLAELPQYAEPWIVFDKDKNNKFDKIIEDAENSGVKEHGLIHVLKHGLTHILVKCQIVRIQYLVAIHSVMNIKRM